MIRLVIVVLAILLLAAGSAAARPIGCMAVVDKALLDQAAGELLRYQTALETGVLEDATMGHIVTLGELAMTLREAPSYGCWEPVTR